MEKFINFQELVDKIKSLEPEEWIYVNLKSWEENPIESNFFYIPEEYIESLDDDEIYLDDNNFEMPLSVEEFNLDSLVSVHIIQYIMKKKNTINDMINEINYYRKYDTFSS